MQFDSRGELEEQRAQSRRDAPGKQRPPSPGVLYSPAMSAPRLCAQSQSFAHARMRPAAFKISTTGKRPDGALHINGAQPERLLVSDTGRESSASRRSPDTGTRRAR